MPSEKRVFGGVEGPLGDKHRPHTWASRCLLDSCRVPLKDGWLWKDLLIDLNDLILILCCRVVLYSITLCVVNVFVRAFGD